MESALLLDVIIGEGTAIFELLTSKDETLLIWGDSLLILDFGLDVFDGIRWLYLEGNGFSSESLDKDLHTASKTEHEMKGTLFLDVVVRESPPIFELLSGKDKTLLIWWNTFLVLNFGLYILDGIRWLDLKSDGLSC